MEQNRYPVLFSLDEAHEADPMVLGRFLNAVQLAGDLRPVGAILAGTPGLLDTLAASRATFWSRGENLAVGLLPEGEAHAVLAGRSLMPAWRPVPARSPNSHTRRTTGRGIHGVANRTDGKYVLILEVSTVANVHPMSSACAPMKKSGSGVRDEPLPDCRRLRSRYRR